MAAEADGEVGTEPGLSREPRAPGDEQEDGAPTSGMRRVVARLGRALLAPQRVSGGFLLTIAALALIVLLPLVFFRLQRDQAHFAYIALSWLEGWTPYVDIKAPQWPGQYGLYAATFYLLGPSELAVRAVDYLLQAGAVVSVAAMAARLSRPWVGAVVAVCCATYYVALGPWDTSNRETYQIALLLPVLYWLLFARLGPRADRVAAALAGGAMTLAILIKPTLGIILPLLVWAVIRPGRDDAGYAWRDRLLFAMGGGAVVLIPFLVALGPHAGAVFEAVVTYNREVYARLAPSLVSRAEMALSLVTTGLYFLPLVWWLAPVPRRRLIVRLAAFHGALISVLLLQAKGFAYHYASVMPLLILWGGVGIASLAERLLDLRDGMLATGWGRAAVLCAAGAAVLFVPPLRLVERMAGHAEALEQGESFTEGRIAPMWDRTVAWLQDNADLQEQQVMVYGLDLGVQFLAGLQPVTYIADRIVDPKDPVLDQHPLLVRRRERLMRELAAQPPDWILVATYDQSWVCDSAAVSLRRFSALRNFILANYSRVPNGIDTYLTYRRR